MEYSAFTQPRFGSLIQPGWRSSIVAAQSTLVWPECIMTEPAA